MSTFVTARWLNLAMLNYEVEPDILAPYVPAGTELDEHNGKTFVSVVGFQFFDTRVRGLRVPFHVNFEEVNLRFYVRREHDGEVRRGVVFVKEIVPRRAIAWVARALYNENYVALPMRHEITPGSGDPRRVQYEWRHRGRWDRLTVELEDAAFRPEPGSEEEFITEHYWGYAMQRDRSTVEYRVEHPQWDVWRAKSAELDCDIAGLYGPEFTSLTGAPSSAFVARGSDTRVHAGVAI